MVSNTLSCLVPILSFWGNEKLYLAPHSHTHPLTILQQPQTLAQSSHHPVPGAFPENHSEFCVCTGATLRITGQSDLSWKKKLPAGNPLAWCFVFGPVTLEKRSKRRKRKLQLQFPSAGAALSHLPRDGGIPCSSLSSSTLGFSSLNIPIPLFPTSNCPRNSQEILLRFFLFSVSL